MKEYKNRNTGITVKIIDEYVTDTRVGSKLETLILYTNEQGLRFVTDWKSFAERFKKV